MNLDLTKAQRSPRKPKFENMTQSFDILCDLGAFVRNKKNVEINPTIA